METPPEKRLNKCDICSTLLSEKPLSGVCSACFDYDQELFDRVKKALRYGERVTPEDLSKRTGVDIKHIQRWTRLGRLTDDH